MRAGYDVGRSTSAKPGGQVARWEHGYPRDRATAHNGRRPERHMNYFISALGGYELITPDGDWVGAALASGSPYEEGLLTLAAALARRGLFVDAGAHIGNHTVFMGRSGCEVVAFEPNPDVRRYLASNIRRNALDQCVRVMPCGLWSARGKGRLVTPDADNSGTTRVTADGGEIDLCTLDSFTLSPELLKIDCEGAECEVLAGAKNMLMRSHPAVFVETHEHLPEVSRFLGSLGYRRAGDSFAASPTFLFVARADHRRLAAPFVASQQQRRFGEVLRSTVKQIPVMGSALSRAKTLCGAAAHAAVENATIHRLHSTLRRPCRLDPRSDVVVSLTSFPARIDHAWIAIESLLQQDAPPRKVVLVLATSEFPGRDLPTELRQQHERGLEILWTDRNTRSYKKLLPTREAYPQATIVTADDDVLYEPQMLSSLCTAARQRPNWIVGHTGAVVTAGRKSLLPYRQWPRADQSTPGDRVFLTGNGGILYPANVLPAALLGDSDLAERLCPAGDDIWFWAVARTAGVPVACLGNHSLHMLGYQHATPQLATLNWNQDYNDVQLRSVFEHFGFFDTLLDDEP